VGAKEDYVMRLIMLAALGAIMLLVSFADDAFAQRRGGGGISRGGMVRGPAFRGGAVGIRGGAVGIRRAGFVGPRVGWRGGVVRRAGWVGPGRVGWRGNWAWRNPGWRFRRAVVVGGLVGAGWGLYGGYPYGYGYGCGVTPRLVWNGWAWQQVWVNTCY
jgi:hypothetical protein